MNLHFILCSDVHVILHLLPLELFLLVFIISFFNWIHSIVLVCLAFIVSLIVGRKLLPRSSDQTSH